MLHWWTYYSTVFVALSDDQSIGHVKTLTLRQPIVITMLTDFLFNLPELHQLEGKSRDKHKIDVFNLSLSWDGLERARVTDEKQVVVVRPKVKHRQRT